MFLSCVSAFVWWDCCIFLCNIEIFCLFVCVEGLCWFYEMFCNIVHRDSELLVKVFLINVILWEGRKKVLNLKKYRLCRSDRRYQESEDFFLLHLQLRHQTEWHNIQNFNGVIFWGGILLARSELSALSDIVTLKKFQHEDTFFLIKLKVCMRLDDEMH